MPVGEEREILPACGEMVGKASPGQRVGERVGRKARHALFAVGYDGRARRLRALDTAEAGRVLFALQICVLDLAGVIVGERLLQLHRPGQRSNGFSGDWHCVSPCFSTLNWGWIVLGGFRKVSPAAANL